MAAKILVPPVRLKEAFRVTADRLWAWLERLESAEDADDLANPLALLAQVSEAVLPGDSYRAPDEFCNIRELR